jgi:hypothetical protein
VVFIFLFVDKKLDRKNKKDYYGYKNCNNGPKQRGLPKGFFRAQRGQKEEK